MVGFGRSCVLARALLSEAETAARIESGEQFCARQAGRIVGCVRLEREDTIFWPDRLSGDALHLHRLAVVRDLAGARVSDALIAWAKGQTKRAGRDLLRLDCAPRAKLYALYERHGFRFVDEPSGAPFHVFRYERAV
jgi:predicted N-acetyltransferase YhbS